MTRSKVKPPPGARKAKLPGFVSPQLATLVKEPPSGDEWLLELKFDGYRMLCRIDRGRVTVWSRNGKHCLSKNVGNRKQRDPADSSHCTDHLQQAIVHGSYSISEDAVDSSKRIGVVSF